MGQDGLVVNVLKYLRGQPTIGFNSDPKRWDGSLAQFGPEEAGETVRLCMEGRPHTRQVTMGAVALSDGQTLLAVNDFFVGVSSHASARYRIRFDKHEEIQSSSGLIVSTPLGRQAWMRSVVTGAHGIVGRGGGRGGALPASGPVDWAEESLYFAVREPFPSVSSATEVVYGRIRAGTTFVVESRMGERRPVEPTEVVVQSGTVSLNGATPAALNISLL